MADDAHAFWVREPGRGEIRAGPLPRARARTRCWCAPCAPGVSRGTETLVFRGGVPPEPVRGDAGAVPGGRLPGAGQVRLPQRRRRRGGPADAASGRTVFCLLPAPDRATSSRPTRSSSCPTTCRRRARCSPAPSRPRSTRCGTPRRWSATGSRWSAPGMVGCCVARLLARIPGVEVTLVDVDPAAPRSRPRSACGFALPARTPGGPRPRRAHQRDRPPGSSARSTCSRRRAPCSS